MESPFYLNLFFIIPLSAAFGLILGFFIYRAYRVFVRMGAELEAEEILREAKDALELQLLEEKERTQEIETEMWTKEEGSLLKLEEHIEELEELSLERKQKSDDKYSQLRQKAVQTEIEVKNLEAELKKKEDHLQRSRQEIQKFNESYTQALIETAQTQKSDILKELVDAELRECQQKAQLRAAQLEEDTKEHAEMRAKEILDAR